MERLRRTMMSLSASNPGMLKDAIIYGANSIMLDLEDAVSLAEKDTSHFLVFQAVKAFDFSSTGTVVCINSPDTGGVDNVHAMVHAGIDVIRLPKTTCAQDVLDTGEVIPETEKVCGYEPGSTRMMVVIEDLRGVLDAVVIAHPGKCLIGIALGSEDYITAMKTKRYTDRNSEETFFARSMIVHAVRIAGITVLDTTLAGVNDMETLRKETEPVRQLGFDGKPVIHPRRIAVVSSVYTPSQKEIDNALNVFRAIEEANAKGSDVIALNDRMIDKSLAECAERVLALAEAVGAYTEPGGQEGQAMETVKNAVGREIPKEYADQYGVLKDQYARKNEYRRATGKVVSILLGETKLVSSLREAIEKSGLKDGVTTSFHHHFREGDYVSNMVMEEIAEMSTKSPKPAASSVANVHEPLIEHIKSGAITETISSGLRDKVGFAISHGLMEKPVVIRSHGGRARVIESGEIHIDVAFLGASSAGPYGSADGSQGSATCGSLGYAKVGVEYADKVVIITDHLVDYPNTLTSISRILVNYAVVVDTIGNPDGITKGITRFAPDPKELLIAKNACKVITASPYFKDDISLQSGPGDSTPAVVRFLAGKICESDITIGYPLGGTTSSMAELFEEGLTKKILDTQTSDRGVAALIARNESHYEISVSFYTDPGNKDTVVNQLDVVILSAPEVDTDLNANVMTGSDGVIRGASGGHSDTVAGAELSLILCPLLRGCISTTVEQVNTATIPGEGIDVVVMEVGTVVNPRRRDLQEALKNAGVNLFTMEELKNKAYTLAGTSGSIEYGDKVVVPIKYRGGSLTDVVRQVKR